ncbi:MAG: tetraacyldisaccharide 4'-kinase [Bacteroidales bacterium]|nr:tetraacyldisaccharide 4'-kinase [Bacteroidales bacterium]MBN2820634.1 tetraacyldisaccharide 4'-kinase [Bacteroidales bacterium]
MRLLLLPFSAIYWLITAIRNFAFDKGFLKSVKFGFPVISVGNITVGGTGKTPHVEYLIKLLQDTSKPGVLSRGYKRKTKGFVLAHKKTNVNEIGDEPFQIFNKFSKISVAVCESRVEGVQKLVEKKPKTKVVLLDDAFQHRYIKPGLSVLLIDYYRPVFKDFLLPAGNLREGIRGIHRADVVVITKVPQELSSDEKNHWRAKLRLNSKQDLFFSGIEYKNPVRLFDNTKKDFSFEGIAEKKMKVLLVTGIANPDPLKDFLSYSKIKFEHLAFADHHDFTQNDIQKIKAEFNAFGKRKKLILTTEKDAMRLKSFKHIPKSIKDKICYVPVSVRILSDQQEQFNSIILNYVKENTGNS